LADNQTLVIGLGRFGQVLAETLVELGDEVLGVDSDQRVVQDCADALTHVVRADSTDAEALRQIGAANFERAVVAIGSDIQASILTTYNLVDLGVATIWAKAVTVEHGAILRRVGAGRVVFPERDMGVRVAHSMIGRTVDYIELDEDFVLLETAAPGELVGRTLREAGVRARHDLTVVCIKRPGGRFSYATPDTRVDAGDLVVVAGTVAAAQAFAELD
jgi:trk system potassium uptake protein TrkA